MVAGWIELGIPGVLLTELYCVQGGNVAAERLHRKDGDLVADISGAPLQSVQTLLWCTLKGRATYPETTFASC